MYRLIKATLTPNYYTTHWVLKGGPKHKQNKNKTKTSGRNMHANTNRINPLLKISKPINHSKHTQYNGETMHTKYLLNLTQILLARGKNSLALEYQRKSCLNPCGHSPGRSAGKYHISKILGHRLSVGRSFCLPLLS